MAQVPYSDGVSQVAPQVQAPDDYQHIQTNPAQFGGALAEGLQQAGAGATKAALFYGQAAADSASNSYQEKVNNLLHGDPNKMVAGQDGQMIPDTGFLGLKGRAAMDQRPAVSSAIDEAMANVRNGLKTPEEQLQFDNFSRRYKTMAMGQIGEHTDQQANQWYGQVNKDTETLALGHIAANADNPTLVANGASELINARTKNAQLQGAQPGDAVWNAAVVGGKRDALIAQVNSIGVKDPAKALDILDKNKDIAGLLYDNVANSLRSRADQQIGTDAGAAAIKDATAASSLDVHARANYANVQNMGDPASPGWVQNNIVPISLGTQTVQVNKQAAPSFQGFLEDLKAHGYNVQNVGGYNYRNKVGTGSGLSQHAFGNAIDINPDANKQGQSGNDFGNIDIRALAAKHGLVWGGDWKGAQRDPMHFEWAGPAGLQPRPDNQTTQMFGGIENHYGLPAGFLAKTMQIESGGRLNPGVSSAGASGPFQFTPGTAQHMGVNPNSLSSSADGAARLAVENAKQLRLGIGRDPSGADLYLAHQQGAGGAAKLINNPDANAASLVGTKAIIQNGGREDMTASQFVQMWANKYNGTQGAAHAVGNPGPQGTALPDTSVQPTAAPGISTAQLALMSGIGTPPAPQASTPSDQTPQVQSQSSTASQRPAGPMALKADAFERVLADPKLSAEARQHALSYISQTLSAQQIAQDQDQRARKQANDDTADQVVQKMYSGDFTGVLDTINHSPDLQWETRVRLRELALHESGSDVEGAARTYGPGFWPAFKAVTAPADDPSRINDVNQLLSKAGPGGDLTLSGVAALQKTMSDIRKNPDAEAVNATKSALMSYAKNIISFQDPSGYIKDPKGEAIFAGQFVPQFMASYNAWTNAGKDPWQFLTKENVDKIASGLRTPTQIAQDKISAADGLLDDTGTAGAKAAQGAQAAQQTPDGAAIPAAPSGVNPQAWNTIIVSPPTSADGKPFPTAAWSQVVSLLANNPTEETIEKFDKSKYAKAGYRAKEIIDRLKTAPGESVTPPPSMAEDSREIDAIVQSQDPNSAIRDFMAPGKK